MTNEITIFNFKQNTVRITIIDNAPFFCGADVCTAIGIKNHRNVLARLKDGVHRVDTIDNLGRKQPISYINEKNLYKIVIQSRKPEAEPFVDWVCGEVLPSIRKTGGYGNAAVLPGVNEVFPKEFLQTVKQAVKEALAEDDISAEIKEYAQTLSPGTDRVSFAFIYARYKAWCGTNGYRPETANILSRNLSSLGFEKCLTITGDKGFYINSDLPSHYVFKKQDKFTRTGVYLIGNDIFRAIKIRENCIRFMPLASEASIFFEVTEKEFKPQAIAVARINEV